MYINHMIQHQVSRPQAYKLLKSNNTLGIERIDVIKDRPRDHLIFLIQTHSILTGEIQALINGSNLILEAALEPNYNKPFRTHLGGRKSQFSNVYDDSVIGFSEISLNQGYQYSIVSSAVINQDIIKIILIYRSLKRNHKYN